MSAVIVPRELTANVWAPVDVRSATITVTQDERVLSRIEVPREGPAPMRIPLAGAVVSDNAVTITLSAQMLAFEGYCLDSTNPLRLNDIALGFDGIEQHPETVANFLPPVLRRLTVFVPATPSRAESDAAVKLTDAIVAHYGQQYTDVKLAALPDNSTIPPDPALPLERQIVIRERTDNQLSLQDSTGMPSLLISGTPAELGNQARLLSSDLSQLALSSGAAVGPLRSTSVLPGDNTTLRQIGQPQVSSVSLAPRVTIGIDQTRFGRSVRGVRVNLKGSYTPLPTTISGRLAALVDGRAVDQWNVDQTGVIDRWIAVPDDALTRFTSITVALDITGNTGRCGEFQPLTLMIDDISPVDSTRADPPQPMGFQSLPQAMMPNVQIGLGTDAFADTSRAVKLVMGLQRVSAMPFNTTVVSADEALAGTEPAIMIAADEWSHPDVHLPVGGGGDQVDTIEGFDDDSNEATLTLQPGFRFGSLQTVFDGDRELLIATSTNAPQLLDGLLDWLNEDIRRWTSLNGIAILAPPERAPVIVAAPNTPQDAIATPPAKGPGKTWWYVGGAVFAALALALLVMLLHSRRRRADDGG
ncbi:hypothetical protein [Mycolicibacterium parafortuitum]|uniref:hypothetical protein n=1 Tax=Mycolicibacterium parafortuitum TaxID=39692 RepID=UPI0009F21214|nr:hypothetical protein [Mycolicibacterium parafortuitum]ORB24146.1 hypothetical protein BST38_28630 [Mycolicibacterium parafortuitum]